VPLERCELALTILRLKENGGCFLRGEAPYFK
jgi:hypothetical protein